YRLVRHPIYLAGLLLAAGSFLAHPSPASACLGAGFALGVVLKAWLEERALRGVLGDEYARYAARVPALIPWPRARGGGGLEPPSRFRRPRHPQGARRRACRRGPRLRGRGGRGTALASATRAASGRGVDAGRVGWPGSWR